MPAFFSSNKQYPLTLKPITSPGDDKTYQDIFNIQNTLRSLLRDLDTILEGYVTEAPEDGKLYGRKDGDWEEVVITPGGDSDYNLIGTVSLTVATKDIVFTLPAYTDPTAFKLELFVTTGSSTNQYVKLFYNSDFTETNYSNSDIGRTTSSILSGFADNSAYVADMGTNVTHSNSSITIYTGPSRKTLATSQSVAATGNLLQLGLRGHVYKNISSVSTITLRHDGTFGAGTVVKLYRIK